MTKLNKLRRREIAGLDKGIILGKNLTRTGSYWNDFIKNKKKHGEMYTYVFTTIIGQRRRMRWRQLKKDLEEIQRLQIAA